MLINGVLLEEGPMNPPHAITLENWWKTHCEQFLGPVGGFEAIRRWFLAWISTPNRTSR